MEQILHQILSTASTVILPHFGAIIKLGESYQFNEFLKYNDGKLIKAVEDAKNISTEEATEAVSDYIRTIKEHLHANKDFSLGTIGSFSKKGEKVIISKSNTQTTAQKEEKKVTKPIVKKEEPTPTPVKKDVVQPEIKKAPTTQKTKEEGLPKAYTSTNLVVDKAIEKIKSFKTVTELTAFSKGETREPVLNALKSRKETLSKPKVTPTPIIEKPTATETKIEEEKKSTDPNLTKQETIKEIAKKDKKIVSPVKKDEEKKPPVTQLNVEEAKKEKKTKITPPIVAPKEELKKETIKKEVKEEKNPVIKTDSKKEETIEKELMAGAIVIEKEAKKRKRNRLILWAAILLLLIGTSIIGFLKKNDILAMINKTEIAENKDLVTPKKKEISEHPTKEEPNHTNASHDEEHSENNTSEHEGTHEEIVAEEDEKVEEVSETEPIETEEVVAEETAAIEEEIVEEAKPVAKGKYNIVVGSFSEKGNATRLVKKLNEDGYNNAQLLGKYGGLYAVSIDNFESRGDAKSALSDIKSKGYSGWIKKI